MPRISKPLVLLCLVLLASWTRAIQVAHHPSLARSRPPSIGRGGDLVIRSRHRVRMNSSNIALVSAAIVFAPAISYTVIDLAAKLVLASYVFQLLFKKTLL